MTIYWDSCALIWFFGEGRLEEVSGVTRTHTLAETFSALTGFGINVILPDGTTRRRKFSPRLAAAIIRRIQAKLRFHELTDQTLVNAFDRAQEKAVQGGRVHDLLHAVAAEEAQADEIWTTDRNDFTGLGSVKVRIVSPQPPAQTPAA